MEKGRHGVFQHGTAGHGRQSGKAQANAGYGQSIGKPGAPPQGPRLFCLRYLEYTYTYGPPMAVAPVDEVRKVLDFAVTQIEPDKIFMGMPNYGYNWTLPYVKGESRADSLSNVAAVELAVAQNAAISYDPVAQAPFFRYNDAGREHEVWFEDARSVEAKLALTQEYGFQGVSYWNIMKYFPQNWLVLNALYNIRRV